MKRGRQATLDELLAEPITRLVMRRDGVSEGEVRQAMVQLGRAQVWRTGYREQPGS